MSFEVKEPVLIVGLGGTGSRLASKAKELLNYNFLQMIRDAKDVQKEGTFIRISTEPVVNPSIPLVRGKTVEARERIREEISQYNTVILFANLAGKDGVSMVPVVSEICKDSNKSIISFAIMPFRFEKDRLFSSGIALKRLQNNSDCTIVLDNDALLESNPDLTTKQCYQIGNSAISFIVESLKKSTIPCETNIISTSKNSELETSLRDSLKMLYETSTPNAIKSSMLYVLGADDVPIGVTNAISNISRNVFDEKGKQVNVATSTSDYSKVVMLTSVQDTTKFDRYDPLSVIPQENALDWDIPETSISLSLDIQQIE